MTARPEPARDLRIDRLRGIAIALVLVHHFHLAYRLYDTTLASLVGVDAVRAVVRNGNYGVTMFFTISGWLITSNALRRWGRLDAIDVRRFYALRIARIVPCLLLLLAVVDVLAIAGVRLFANRTVDGGSVSLLTTHVAALTFWMNVLVAREGWFNYALGVLWSLSVEEVFYLAFPIVCVTLRGGRVPSLVVFLLVVATIGPAWRATHAGDDGDSLYAYLACFDAIAIGCLAALASTRGGRRPGRVVQGAIVVGMGVLYLSWSIGVANVLGVSAMALGTAALLLGSRGANTSASRVDPLAACGRLSYELYLFHLVVLGLLRTVFPPASITGDAKLVLFAAFALGSFVVARLVARLFSEPANRVLRRRWGRSSSTVANV